MNSKIVDMNDTLTGEAAVDLPDRIKNNLLSHQYASTKANNAALVIGQLVSCNTEKNKNAKNPVLKEPSLFFEDCYKLRRYVRPRWVSICATLHTGQPLPLQQTSHTLLTPSLAD